VTALCYLSVILETNNLDLSTAFLHIYQNYLQCITTEDFCFFYTLSSKIPRKLPSKSLPSYLHILSVRGIFLLNAGIFQLLSVHTLLTILVFNADSELYELINYSMTFLVTLNLPVIILLLFQQKFSFLQSFITLLLVYI